MPSIDRLGANPVRHLNFDLAPDKPIQVFSDLYNSCSASKYDMHYELELGVVLSGKMLRKYPAFEMLLEYGDIWLCGVWEPHGFIVRETPCEVFYFVISPEFLINTEYFGISLFDLFTIPTGKCFHLPKEKRKEILHICRNLYENHLGDSHVNNLWYMLALFQLLLSIIEKNPDLLRDKKVTYMDHYLGIQPSLKMVYNSKKFVSISDAAKACSMSPSHFSKLFKELMGIPFAQFALRYRIKEAARELITKSDSIKAIALKWGFTDTSHFHNCFRKNFSISPTEYRRINKNNS